MQCSLFDQLKRCSACSDLLPATPEFFNRCAKHKDGLTYKCKVCLSEYFRQHYQVNAEHKKRLASAYHWDNREDVLEKKRKWWYVHHERNLQRTRDWHRKNRDRSAELSKAWYHANLDNARASKRMAGQRRRARISQVAQTLTSEEWQACLVHFSGLCAYCGSNKPLEQDHLLPLVHGGGYVAENIVPACATCNRSKQALDFSEWYPQQDCYSDDRKEKILRYLEEVA